MLHRSLLGAVLVGAAIQAQAAVVFSDNFDASASGLNVVPTGWIVTDGTVDVVGGSFCQSGQCVDLDGSTGNAGVLSRTFSLDGGVEYNLSFELSGNKRGGSDDVTIMFGAQSLVLTGLPSAEPYTNHTLHFRPDADGVYAITFSNAGGDNIGALLDNVSIVSIPIPEPQTYVLMALALAAVGVATRRRRK
jgi:PEP-CTERM motif